ncbi:hypothetical protein B0T26DRAFT_686404 [Lasiosphaeria miniovina]|uniref:Uncharacterized protein n=1 Tax=Lasiosphaeria miniovina TaxID=1954250 RepID=A0AA40BGP8_9PEZI|nr:uncharacterized protein B0T26DRAFT_686404 [Lasiosphaeria miniovina]KAK0733914.1 hypothetical protein B0T26DRAFT_686404 [Lasiosphaeria miniovina]
MEMVHMQTSLSHSPKGNSSYPPAKTQTRQAKKDCSGAGHDAHLHSSRSVYACRWRLDDKNLCIECN